ncbi:hypothetical protein AWM70_21485 [Paenibacillus yonginensis]|uniref:Uncharacterized protein n=1 Tax=Paenibacillus yonginensis TaxID=1462996 RepID=A0A1B1N626_9BACL|nr:hypothetical protein [Paenibacillus yonginensis]ANS76835.1 hypothetical protein AWM70_21485 [Paenibacillus yonginensis]
MECIVYFDVVYENEIKELRGLIFLDEDRLPAEQDYLNMFTDMGYQLRLEKQEPLTFVPAGPGAEYKEIRIRRLDTGKEEDHYEDPNLKNMVANLLPNKPKSI